MRRAVAAAWMADRCSTVDMTCGNVRPRKCSTLEKAVGPSWVASCKTMTPSPVKWNTKNEIQILLKSLSFEQRHIDPQRPLIYLQERYLKTLQRMADYNANILLHIKWDTNETAAIQSLSINIFEKGNCLNTWFVVRPINNLRSRDIQRSPQVIANLNMAWPSHLIRRISKSLTRH